MIEIVGAGLVFVCNEEFEIIHNGAIAFESSKDSILRVGAYEDLCAQFPHAKKHFSPHGVLLPALINAHIHFEFGAHLASFAYGDFGAWLDSLMAGRESVLHTERLESIITQGVNEQIQAGVGSVGAVSSYGEDMEILAHSPLRVVYFNEAIGSNEGVLDVLYSNLLARYEQARSFRSARFTPALALHSPYSVHTALARKVVALAIKEGAPLSAHFLESKQEREWLELSSGYFRGFFQRLAGIDNPCSFCTPLEFLELFRAAKGLPISFTHCLQVGSDEQAMIERLNASIITCPRSNRLLNNAYLPASLLDSQNLALGTDGKSSNHNVSLLDELRTALFAYPTQNLNALAKALLLAATRGGARALGLENGILAQGKSVDFALFEFEKLLYHANQAQNHTSCNQAPLHFILHAASPTHLYINAKAVI